MMWKLVEDESLPDDFRWEVAEELIEIPLANRRQFARAVELAKKMGTRTEIGNEEKYEIDLMPWSLEREADLRSGGKSAQGSRPTILLDSRGLGEVELELWQIVLDEDIASFGLYGFARNLVFDSRPHQVPRDDGTEDAAMVAAWVGKHGRKLKTWKVPIRQKANLR
jgi:hypothetical protein